MIGGGVPQGSAVLTVQGIHRSTCMDEDLNDAVIAGHCGQVHRGDALRICQCGVCTKIEQARDHHQITCLSSAHEHSSVMVIPGIRAGVGEEPADSGEVTGEHDFIKTSTIDMVDQVMVIITRGNWKHTKESTR